MSDRPFNCNTRETIVATTCQLVCPFYGLFLIWTSLIACLPNAVAEKGKTKNFLKEDFLGFPFAKQEMWGLRHQYHDPKTGELRYEIRAKSALSRVENAVTFFDATEPRITYYDNEIMSLESKTGVVDIKNEKLWFKGNVIGYLTTAKDAEFATQEVEMSFEGSGISKWTIRFTMSGVVIDGKSSRFRRELLSEKKPAGRKIFRIEILGPGTARFEKVSPGTKPAGAPKSVGSRFVVKFQGSANYSQKSPTLIFQSDQHSETDRVELYGNGYILRCRELRVHASPDMKSWERIESLGNVSYEAKPDLNPDEIK